MVYIPRNAIVHSAPVRWNVKRPVRPHDATDGQLLGRVGQQVFPPLVNKFISYFYPWNNLYTGRPIWSPYQSVFSTRYVVNVITGAAPYVECREEKCVKLHPYVFGVVHLQRSTTCLTYVKFWIRIIKRHTVVTTTTLLYLDIPRSVARIIQWLSYLWFLVVVSSANTRFLG